MDKMLGGYQALQIRLLNGRIFQKLLSKEPEAQYRSEQGKILTVLWQKEDGRATATDIALASGLANNTLTSMIKKLVDQGLVTIEQSDQDKRKKFVVLTELGWAQKEIGDRVSKELGEIFYQGFGINHSEIFTRKGQSPSVKFPRVLGIECVGLVEETTRPDLKIGQQIISIMGEMGRAFDGGYAEYTLLPNDQIYPIKTELDLESLIALPETYYTAFDSFLNLKIEEKDSVLVRGATSGVGIAFAKLLKGKFPNIHLTGTSRNLAKEEQLKVVGFDQVILEKDGVLHTKEQFDKVLDLVGPSAILDTFARTAEGGIICSCGLLGGQWTVPDFDPIEMLSRNLYLTTFASGNVSQDKLQALVDFVEQYRVDVRTEKVYQIDQIQEAHAYLEGSHSFGKVIVKNEED